MTSLPESLPVPTNPTEFGKLNKAYDALNHSYMYYRQFYTKLLEENIYNKNMIKGLGSKLYFNPEYYQKLWNKNDNIQEDLKKFYSFISDVENYMDLYRQLARNIANEQQQGMVDKNNWYLHDNNKLLRHLALKTAKEHRQFPESSLAKPEFQKVMRMGYLNENEIENLSPKEYQIYNAVAPIPVVSKDNSILSGKRQYHEETVRPEIHKKARQMYDMTSGGSRRGKQKIVRAHNFSSFAPQLRKRRLGSKHRRRRVRCRQCRWTRRRR